MFLTVSKEAEMEVYRKRSNYEKTRNSYGISLFADNLLAKFGKVGDPIRSETNSMTSVRQTIR